MSGGDGEVAEDTELIHAERDALISRGCMRANWYRRSFALKPLHPLGFVADDNNTARLKSRAQSSKWRCLDEKMPLFASPRQCTARSVDDLDS